MKILMLSGSHARHLYYVNKINQQFPLSALMVEKREHILPKPPLDTDERDKKLFERHFQERENCENKYFGKQSYPNCQKYFFEKENLNTEASVGFLKKINPDIVLVFGTHLIKEPLFSALPQDTINLHLGLSPRYRGDATLFWPFYFLEPFFAGSTFHYIVNEPDAGAIIHQSVPELQVEDGIHDVACKVVLTASKEAVQLLQIYKKNGKWKKHSQRATGKNFLGSDFQPAHLRLIYETFNNDIVRCCLEGRIEKREPKLIRQF